jgi:hypothetical protein
MISDDTATKSEPASAPSSTPSETPSKPEASAPSSYSRGEGQKAVSRAYRENWNLIFGEKPKASSKKVTAKKASAKRSRKTTKPAKKTKR